MWGRVPSPNPYGIARSVAHRLTRLPCFARCAGPRADHAPAAVRGGRNPLLFCEARWRLVCMRVGGRVWWGGGVSVFVWARLCMLVCVLWGGYHKFPRCSQRDEYGV